MLAVETAVPSHRRIHYDPNENKKLLNMSLDLIDERRKKAALKAEAHKWRIATQYNSEVKHHSLKESDLVLKTTISQTGGVDPIWEGPYFIHKDLGNEVFNLNIVYGAIFGKVWNANNLYRYFT